jgi:hypothetical protein
MSRKRILIFIPIGDSCEALSWIDSLLNIHQYEIHFFLLYYGTDDSFGELFNDSRISFNNDQSSSKFEKFHKYVNVGKINLNDYDFFWLVDDDIRISQKSASNFFHLFDTYHLDIAQPGCLGFAMGKQIVRRDSRFLLRFTNYVDGMAPIFSRRAVENCLHTFENSQSGRGIDHVWAALLENPLDKIAVIDSSLMMHMKPSGGEYSRFNNSIENQYRAVRARYEANTQIYYAWEDLRVHHFIYSKNGILKLGLLQSIINRCIEIQSIGARRLVKHLILRSKNKTNLIGTRTGEKMC